MSFFLQNVKRQQVHRCWRSMNVQYVKGDFTYTFGVNDAFNQKYEYVQLSDGVEPQLPDKSREFFAKVTYEF